MNNRQKIGYRYFLKPEKMSELKSQFYLLTCSRYGDQETLTRAQLLHLLLKEGFDISMNYLSYFDRQLFKQENKTYYTSSETIRIVDRLSVSPEIEKELKKVFKVFDINNRNKLTAMDLRRTINSCHGKGLDRQQIQQIFNELDIDRDGLVSFEDFLCAIISK